ncbi:MAG TPA: hypothetical protein VL854_05985 [Nitrososphaeraceae archaeon]|nr:hypothetical protein [Nitrososphaeraceae archaeon]
MTGKYKLFTEHKSERTGSYYEHWNDIQVSANDQDPLAIELVNNFRNIDGTTKDEYDNGKHRYKMTTSEQYGSTIWQNESRKAKSEYRQEQKKQNDEERNKRIQDMADKRDQKFNELITVINNLKTSIENLTSAIEQKNFEESN